VDFPEAVRQQYATTDPLKVRIETHRLYEERRVDLDEEAAKLLDRVGDESVLDVGCGPGRFLDYLRHQGHAGRLVGLDQSAAMLLEGAHRARTAGLAIDWVRADAVALPLPASSFDWVVARHMLYHVADKPAALRELARVSRPSGGVLVATNARRSLPLIHELTVDALDHFGLPRNPWAAGGFSLEDAPDLLGQVFSAVDAVIIPNALVFTSVEPIVRYVETAFPSLDQTPGPAFRAEVHAWLLREAGRRLASSRSVWRDPKEVGFFVCRRE
jgi:SAM-dependent methyltransferase